MVNSNNQEILISNFPVLKKVPSLNIKKHENKTKNKPSNKNINNVNK